MTESGADHIFIETGSFEVNVVEQILNGSHYARSIKAFFVLSEALLRHLLENFLDEKNCNSYNNELTNLIVLQDSFLENNFLECKSLFEQVNQNSSELMHEFNDFVKIKNKK